MSYFPPKLALPPETEWLHWSVLPTIAGAYKREWWPGSTYYAWWTGCAWGRLATTPELARRYAMDGEMSTHRKLRWCGLAVDPAAWAAWREQRLNGFDVDQFLEVVMKGGGA